ncbi:MAG: DUF3817 domain-containing protein [Myxococcota bacterium]
MGPNAVRYRLTTPIGRLRVVAFVEGCSYLALLGIAMPLKYFAGIPGAVRIVGLVHGVLFILFCFALLQAMLAARWSLLRAGVVFASSLIPFGTFLIDGQLKREDEVLRCGNIGPYRSENPSDAHRQATK